MALLNKHQLKFNIHKDAKSRIEAIEKRFGVNTALRIFAASSKAKVSTLPNVDSLSDTVIYSFFSSHSNSPQLDNEDLNQIDPDDLEEIDLKWQMDMLTMRAKRFLKRTGKNLGANETYTIRFDMSKVECYNYHRRGHFGRKCRSPRDNRNKEPTRRTIPAEVSTSNALISQFNPVGGYDWSFQADEEATNYALMAYASSGSSSSSRSDNETSSKNLSKLLESQVSDKTGLGFDSLVFISQVSNYEELHSYESVDNVFNVESSTNKPGKDMSKTYRHGAPTVEDWISDSEDETEIESVPKQKEPSFVTSTDPVQSSRESVQKVKHHKQAANLRTNNKKSRVRMTHPHSNRNVVPTLVLTRSRLVSLNTARHVPIAVTQSSVKSSWPVKHVVNKAHSPGNPQQALQDKGVINSSCSRHITGNISFPLDFKEINRGYVAFGGNPKGDTERVVLSSEFKLPDENHVLLRVPRENNMYNVDLKNVAPLGDLTCVFAKATLDEKESNIKPLLSPNLSVLSANLYKGLVGYFLATKDETSAILKTFITGIENQINYTAKIIRCDNKIEFKNHDLNQFYGMKGIKREFIVARTSQQNRVAERKNRTLIEAARTMLADLLLPIPFWAKAVNTACYVQNKAFRVFNSRTRIVQETLHIDFLENKPNVAGIGPKWILDIDNLTMSMNYQPVFTGNQPNDNAGIKENLDACKVKKETVSAQQYMLLLLWSTGLQDPQNLDDDDVADVTFDVKENENDVHVFANGSDKTDNKKHNEKAKRDDKGKSHVDSLIRVRDLRAKFKEFSFNNTNRLNAVSAPANAAGPNPTNSTNSFNTVSPSVNDVSLNFGIARKYSFVDPFKYPDDPYMPELEDIVYSDDEEVVGAETDLSNLERNIPVSPILTTRVHKDHPINQIIGDLNLAPQTRSMTRMVKEQGGLHQINDEDFHTCMFTYFLSQEEPKKGHTQEEGIDYDEVFAPVARIEATRLFLGYASFIGFMVYQMDVKSDFLYETIEEEVYFYQPPGFKDPDYPDKVYVDDIIFGSTNKELCKAFEKLMKDKFKMSSMGELTFFLRLQLKQKDNGIFISQDKYVAKILRKLSFTNVKSSSTPIEIEKPLLKDLNGEDVDVHIYRSMVRSLMYLTLFRPDIMFAICACPKYSPFNLVAYSDSDYAGASLDWKSTTRVNAARQFITAVSYELMLFGLLKVAVVNLMLLGHKLMLLRATTIVKKVNDDVQLRALIDGKKVVVSEAILRRDLHLDDADRVKCLSNEEIFEELARIGYEKPPLKLTFYKNEFNCSMASVVIYLATVDDITTYNTRYTSLALTQKVFPNMRRVGKGFSVVESHLFASMLVQPQPQAEEEVEIPIAPIQPSTTSSPSPTALQDPTPTPYVTPPQDQPLTPYDLPHKEQPTTPHEYSIPLLTTLMETCATLSQKVVELKREKHSQALEILQLKKRVKKLEKKKKSQSLGFKRLRKIEAIETDKGITLVDVETDEKVVAMDAESQERLNQEEMTEEDLQLMLEIVPVPEFKVEALQLKIMLFKDLKKMHKGITTAGSSIAVGSTLVLLDKVDAAAEVLKNLL
nr:hypothetical protein [Tanacetum cinerariifolium]